MTSLKQEYAAKKRLNEMKNLIEAKYFLDENTILFEELNSEKLQQMADAMQKLNAVVASKNVPSLKKAVGAAAKEMQDFVNNKSILKTLGAMIMKDKAMNPITKSMTLFSALSKFFKDDMPHILQSFNLKQGQLEEDQETNQQQAGQQPQQQQQANQQQAPAKPQQKAKGDIPLMKQLDSGTAKRLETMFAKGLRPGGFLGFLGLKQLPFLDAAQTARELLSLSPNDLNAISANVEKIQLPMSAEDRNELMQTAKGQVPQPLQQVVQQATGASTPTNNPAQQVFTTLKSLITTDQNKVIEMIKASNNMNDFLNKVQQLGSQATPQPAAPAQPVQAAPAAATPAGAPKGGARRRG